MVIIPKNYNLFSVNVFVAITGLYQLFRIYRYSAFRVLCILYTINEIV